MKLLDSSKVIQFLLNVRYISPVDPKISVIVSVYGRLERHDVLTHVLKGWSQQTIEPEVILAEQNSRATGNEQFARSLGIRYIRCFPDIMSEFNIGRVRNAGLSIATGDVLYFTDADVYPLRSDYLFRLLRERERTGAEILYRPLLFRLAENCTRSFLSFLEDSFQPRYSASGCLVGFADGEIFSYLRYG